MTEDELRQHVGSFVRANFGQAFLQGRLTLSPHTKQFSIVVLGLDDRYGGRIFFDASQVVRPHLKDVLYFDLEQVVD